MFEYLHAGLPMAVSDVHSMKAFVETHGIGLPFVAEDAGSCSETISRLLGNLSSFKYRISEELKRKYSWEEQEQKIHSIYSRLIKATRPVVTDDKRERAVAWEKMEVVIFEAIYARALISAACKADNLATPKIATPKIATPKIATPKISMLKAAIRKVMIKLQSL
jgi:hypothetical protein